MSDEADTDIEETERDPVRKWTLIILGLCVVLMGYYLIADRITPYTTQARVHAVVVPIAPEVSGTVTEVAVPSNQDVAAGDLLLTIDRSKYLLAVETAEANLQQARQATAVSTANVDAAGAQVETAKATLLRASQDASRLRRIKQEDPGAISDRRLEGAEATLSISQAQLEAAEATLEKALQDLGAEGDDNSRILQAQAALDAAHLDLSNTEVRARSDGIVTDVRVDRGNFANAGAALMTFLATRDIWVQLPGKVIKGTVRTTGLGVQVDSTPLGSLPTIDNDREWLRDAQRFSVIIDFQLPSEKDRMGIRVGAQASVIVYTGGGFLFNTLGRIKMWLESIFTYVY
jgi:multidrug resistance efflux pump